jgi:hypothetical protein
MGSALEADGIVEEQDITAGTLVVTHGGPFLICHHFAGAAMGGCPEEEKQKIQYRKPNTQRRKRWAGAISARVAPLDVGSFPRGVLPFLGSSSSQTRANMPSVAPIGVPIVIANTFSMGWIFRGNVQREHLVY